MDDVRRSVAMLAARVRDTHPTHVWAPLSHGSWQAYCNAEFSINLAQAYRLLNIACALTATPIHEMATAGTDVSMRDTGRALRPRSTTACPCEL
ncbi:hypothetical protein [Streptomyces yangpuensis]|uniref:hypothetical protein n=1 Tax=Streptomyces yangpuensis TaxID=1648182 RepID=UPI003661C214